MRITAPISSLLKCPPTNANRILQINAFNDIRYLSTNVKKASPPPPAAASASVAGATTDTSNSFLEAASSYISSFRLKVASTVSSSLLTPSERKDLLIRLNGQFTNKEAEADEVHVPSATLNDKAANQKDVPHSIGEAVAAAMAKEALNKVNKQQKQILQRERDEIFKRAEQAVLHRVENDLLIQERRLALERWTNDLKVEKEQKAKQLQHQQQHQQQQQQQLQEQEPGEASDIVEIESPTVTVTAQPQQPIMEDHAILGPALVDLGYKRVHLVSTSKLSAIPIWEQQRVYRHDRAKVMAMDKVKSLPLGFPGIISLHESTNGELSILDGQHRVGMLTLLFDKLKDQKEEEEEEDKMMLLERILVEVFPQQQQQQVTTNGDDATTTMTNHGSSHAKDLFTEINKAEPVKLVDMPGVAKLSDRRIITDASQSLQDAYPQMFKPSQKCRPPHLNIDNLRDAIFASNVLSRHELNNVKTLVSWLTEQNLKMKKDYMDARSTKTKKKKGDSTKKVVSDSALKKAMKYDFYLGLDLAWLYR